MYCLELVRLATKPPRGLLDRTPVLPPAPKRRRPECILYDTARARRQRIGNGLANESQHTAAIVHKQALLTAPYHEPRPATRPSPSAFELPRAPSSRRRKHL